MTKTAPLRPAEARLVELSLATEIDRFLSGESDGRVLFQELYGAVAEEPIPERLLAILREADDAAPRSSTALSAEACRAATP